MTWFKKQKLLHSAEIGAIIFRWSPFDKRSMILKGRHFSGESYVIKPESKLFGGGFPLLSVTLREMFYKLRRKTGWIIPSGQGNN